MNTVKNAQFQDLVELITGHYKRHKYNIRICDSAINALFRYKLTSFQKPE